MKASEFLGTQNRMYLCRCGPRGKNNRGRASVQIHFSIAVRDGRTFDNRPDPVGGVVDIQLPSFAGEYASLQGED